MAMTISGSTGVVFPDGTSQASGQQACKAWVNFNGSGTVAIRAAYNVTSITDNGTGSYTVNFTTAMTDANYSWVSLSGSPGVTNGYTIAAVPTASAVLLVTVNTAANLYDPVYVTCSVFR
jgi:hypothetical protein